MLIKLILTILAPIVLAGPGIWEEQTYPKSSYYGRALYYSQRASNRLKVHDLWGALNDYSLAIDFTPEAYDLYLNRARAHCLLEQYENANSDLKLAHELAAASNIGFRTPAECRKE